MQIRTKEEVANTVTHLAGAVLAPLMTAVLAAAGGGSLRHLLSALTFGFGVLALYTASTVYHFAMPGRLKRCLRYADHIGIYVLIAASYTPVLLCSVGGTAGWTVFGLLWALAALGAVYKLFFLGRWPRLSLALYLAMGWSGVAIAVPVWRAVPAEALWCIFAEGIFYTAGSWFYARDVRRYWHAVWHVFVLLGTLAHFAAVWIIYAMN
ncbi:MAG: hemolysin III family protein [Prevotellaceae bacterium]|nr:hemolysin III family protein [Prevotellaceae bacterium]